MVQPDRGYGRRGRGDFRGGHGRGGFGRGGRGRHYQQQPPQKAHKSTAEMVAYPEERGGAYRPMGAALTIQEVSIQLLQQCRAGQLHVADMTLLIRASSVKLACLQQVKSACMLTSAHIHQCSSASSSSVVL